MRRSCCSVPRRKITVAPRVRVVECGLKSRTRSSPRVAWVLTMSPSAIRASEPTGSGVRHARRTVGVHGGSAPRVGDRYFSSMISRTTLRLAREAAALRIVRIDFAVRPCLPMMRPRSSFATFSSNTDAVSPCDFLHLDGVGVIHQGAGQELDQFLHAGVSPGDAAAMSAPVARAMPLRFMSCATVSEGRAPRRSQSASFSRWN